jgi:hypothetical protein
MASATVAFGTNPSFGTTPRPEPTCEKAGPTENTQTRSPAIGFVHFDVDVNRVECGQQEITGLLTEFDTIHTGLVPDSSSRALKFNDRRLSLDSRYQNFQ